MSVARHSHFRRAVLSIGLGALALVWLVPFLFLMLTAFRAQGELLSFGVFSWPHEIRWSNFAAAWRFGHFGTYFANSLAVAAIKVPLGIFIGSLAAYPLAKIPFKGDKVVFLAFLLGLAVPIHVTLLPLAILSRHLGLADTLWALVPPYVAFGLPFQILVMRGFFKNVPTELIEAARLDGASELRIFLRIMLPLSRPALATLFIIDFVGTWNELLMALVLLSSESSRTLPLGLLSFQGQFGGRFGQLSAAILIAVAPILLVYVLFQRYLVAGITAGAVKE